jgi:foldase protein PrsA
MPGSTPTRSRLLALILATLGVLAVVGLIAGFSYGVPSDDVATVSDSGDIPKAGPTGFDHWYAVVWRTTQAQQQQQGGRDRNKQKAPPNPQSEEGKPLTDQVMQFLITAQWILGEASERGIELSQQQVQRAFAKTKKQSFPKGKDYRKFLKDTGQNEQDVLFRVRLEQLSNRIQKDVVAGADKVSDDEIASYYEENKEQFGTPASRDIQEVVVGGTSDASKQKAGEALAALKKGQGFASVVKKFSTDPTTKANQGKMPGLTRQAAEQGTQDKTLVDAAFSASKGKLVGPIKTQQGYVVFKVTKETKGTQQSLEQAKQSIEQVLAQQNQSRKLALFKESFNNKWRARTLCATDYTVSVCANGREEAAAQAPPTPPGQEKVVPGTQPNAQYPPALDNPTGGGPQNNLAGGAQGGPALLRFTQGESQLPGGPLGGAGQNLPLALGGVPKEGAPGAGGFSGGIQGLGGAGAAPPPGQ